MKTINRGWLLSQVRKGNVLARCDNYMMPDDFMVDPQSKRFKPAVIIQDNGRINDAMNFYDFDFKSKSGCAYAAPDNEIKLIVTGNESYTLKLKCK